MPNQSKQTMKSLRAEIGRDFEQYADKLLKNIRSLTPVDSGRAQRGWVNKYNDQIGKASRDTKFILFANKVPYIDILEKGSSRQAPAGMINPALKRTRKPR